MIALRGVNKSYASAATTVHVLHDLELEIPHGEFAFILGPSGSGKSTLLYLLGGLEQTTSGEISIDGNSLSEMSSSAMNQLRRDEIGFIFQSFNLLRTLDCLDNVLVPFLPTGQAYKYRSAARQLLIDVGLGDRIHHRPSELSGGEQQRVAIARALLKKPKLILADEPTGELDSETGERIFSMLRDLNQNEGVTVVTVTHDHRYLRENDRIFRMEDGRLVNSSN
ncbi:ABC transporter ATP-binding protein [Thalassoglobus sp. JC818]|uniref:ABC transporter ATP-binding protein n=1 Tax=Thalassoglobus sp. JC818 TaxID=3232136 RepID=UPI003457554F